MAHPVPQPSPPPTLTNPNKCRKMSFCASVLSEADSSKSEFIFLNRSTTAHKKGRNYFFLLLLAVLVEAEVIG